MEHLPGGLCLDIPKGCFPLSTDSMVLGHFVKLPRNAQVLDLGSGCGTLGMLLCARDLSCHVTGLEITEQAHLAALETSAAASWTPVWRVYAPISGRYLKCFRLGSFPAASPILPIFPEAPGANPIPWPGRRRPVPWGT